MMARFLAFSAIWKKSCQSWTPSDKTFWIRHVRAYVAFVFFVYSFRAVFDIYVAYQIISLKVIKYMVNRNCNRKCNISNQTVSK